jgi:hypothetical protein
MRSLLIWLSRKSWRTEDGTRTARPVGCASANSPVWVLTKSARLPLYRHRPAGFKLGGRIERLLVHVPDHLLSGLSPIARWSVPSMVATTSLAKWREKLARLMSAST